MLKIISTADAPKAIGPYSQAIKTGKFLYVSGQLPIDPITGNVVGNNIMLQTQQSLSNLRAIVMAAKMSLDDVVKVSVFLSDMNNFTAMNEVYATFFNTVFPARVCVEVARLPKDVLVEIEAVAFKE